MAKQRVAVIFGGQSGEHEVSVVSARSVMSALDAERWEVVPLAITRAGAWLGVDDTRAGVADGRRAFDSDDQGGLLRSAEALEALASCEVASVSYTHLTLPTKRIV